MTYIQEIYQPVIDGQNKAVQEKVQAAINAGVAPEESKRRHYCRDG